MSHTDSSAAKTNNRESIPADMPDLADLIARCVLRDQMALKRLYHLAGAQMNAVIYRIVKSNEIAEEVLQEAFIQIWENASSYRSDMAKPLTWLTSIARYRALDRLDKEKRLAKRIVSSDADENYTEPAGDQAQSPSPELAYYWRQQSQHIVDCMAGLTEQVQSSIKLAYLEGYSRDEIAEVLSTNANTVKSWLHRGAERLRQCLKNKI